MFYDFIYPNLRTYNGTVWGIGIREVPGDKSYRKILKKEIEKELVKFEQKQ